MTVAGQSRETGTAWGRFPLWLRVGFWVCMFIAVAVVIRRAIELLTGPGSRGPQQMAALDAFFSSHAALTWAHILCALVFVLLLPFLFWKRTANSKLLARTFFTFGFVVGATAYAMSATPVGGWLERSAVLFYDSLFLMCLVIALLLRGRGDAVNAQRWILRSVAIVLGIATTRPVMGVFFATSRATHLVPQQFFGMAFWIGFSINAIGMELWLQRRAFRAGGKGR